MKDLVRKLLTVLLSLKDKKPKVILIVLGIFILGYYGVQKGYVPQELLDLDLITEEVEKAVAEDSLKQVVDTLSQAAPVVDTTVQ
jgi:uncharacterized membrane protein (Fun14 family)